MQSPVQEQLRGTFLVVDDEPDILDAIVRLFRREYHVLTAQNVAEAWEIIEREDVQVIMTDQRMPKMSGIEFLTELSKTHPTIVRVLFTGYSNISDVVDAINEGHVYRYISKPWKPAELRLFVAQAFEYYSAQRERDELLDKLSRANELLERQNALLSAANEELKVLDRVKNVFMEIVSHELNTPIAIIFGYTFLLRKELNQTVGSVGMKALSGIDTSAVRLKNISNRIFKMLGEDSPKPSLSLEWVDIGKFVASLREQIDPFLLRRQQSLEVTVDPSIRRIMADEDKLNDICLNLLMNAIKFSYDKQTIELSIAPDSNDGDFVSIEVRDRGIGITDEDVSQIFDVFFSTFKSGHHSSGEFEFGKRGIGLGLPVARRFAEMHGGHIRVSSEEGEGSRFTLFLPLAPKAQVAASPGAEGPAKGQDLAH